MEGDTSVSSQNSRRLFGSYDLIVKPSVKVPLLAQATYSCMVH